MVQRAPPTEGDQVIIRCRCCGVILPDGTPRATIRRCVVCDLCDRRHGDEREAVVTQLVADGRIDAWLGIATMAVDDAHLAGCLEFVGDPRAADMWIAKPVARWAVVIARALAMGEAPSASEVIGAVVGRYLPGTSAQIPEIKAELADALRVLDPGVVDVEVRTSRDALDPAHLSIDVLMQPAVAGTTTFAGASEIPDDIATRTRGQA